MSFVQYAMKRCAIFIEEQTGLPFGLLVASAFHSNHSVSDGIPCEMFKLAKTCAYVKGSVSDDSKMFKETAETPLPVVALVCRICKTFLLIVKCSFSFSKQILPSMTWPL